MGVLSILRNEVEINRSVHIHLHNSIQSIYILRTSLYVSICFGSPRDGCFLCNIRGRYWSGMYSTPKDTIGGLPKGFLIHCRASMGYIVGDCTVGNRAQGDMH